MSTPEPRDALDRRIEAVETELFEMALRLGRLSDATDRNTAGLDVLEDSLDEITTLAPDPDALAAAMAQRQSHLDGQDALDLGDVDAGTVSILEIGADAGEGAGPDAAPWPYAGGQPPPGDELVLAGIHAVAIPAGAGNGAGPPAGPPPLSVLHAWVEQHIASLVRKTTTTGEGGGVRWCQHWWEHRDAVDRFQALYLAYTELSGEESATWLSVYLRDHLDPHLATLTSPYGPFCNCTPKHHSDAIQPLGQAAQPGSTPAAAVPVWTGAQP